MAPKFLRFPGTHLAIHAHLSHAYQSFLITASGFAAFVFRTRTNKSAGASQTGACERHRWPLMVNGDEQRVRSPSLITMP